MNLYLWYFFDILNHKGKTTTNRKENKMTVSISNYKVGDLFTTQKSKVTGTIVEIKPTDKNTVRVKLDVNGNMRWTTWKA